MKYSNLSKSPACELIKKDMKSVRSMATKLFLGTLGLFAVINLAAILYLQFRPESEIQASPSGFLQACQELCAKYGLVDTGDIAHDAQAYLAAARQEAVETAKTVTTNSQAKSSPDAVHPLLGKPAPQFTLNNDKGEPVNLADMNRNGPVVVVFYYGYFCSHCVAQLFAINEELAGFSQAGARVVALSADSSEHTAEMFKQYGRFDFPVLADEDRSVAVAYGCYRPKSSTADEDMQHGTFVIDRQGIVRWANTGYTPFLDNQKLLQVLRDFNSGPSTESQTTSVTVAGN